MPPLPHRKLNSWCHEQYVWFSSLNQRDNWSVICTLQLIQMGETVKSPRSIQPKLHTSLSVCVRVCVCMCACVRVWLCHFPKTGGLQSWESCSMPNDFHPLIENVCQWRSLWTPLSWHTSTIRSVLCLFRFFFWNSLSSKLAPHHFYCPLFCSTAWFRDAAVFLSVIGCLMLLT